MSSKRVEPETYYIPNNFLDSGKVFNGRFKLRNFVEAVIFAIPFVLLFVWIWQNNIMPKNFCLSFGICVCGGVFVFFVGGVNGESVLEFLFSIVDFRNHRHIAKYNPRIKTEIVPDYLVKEKESLPREKLIGAFGVVSSYILGDDGEPINEDLMDEDIVMYFTDDVGYVEKPKALKTARELKEDAKRAKKKAKEQAKKDREYLKTLPPKKRAAKRKELKLLAKTKKAQEAAERAEEMRKQQEYLNRAIEKAEKEKLKQLAKERKELERAKREAKEAAAAQKEAKRLAKERMKELARKEREEEKAKRIAAKKEAQAQKTPKKKPLKEDVPVRKKKEPKVNVAPVKQPKAEKEANHSPVVFVEPISEIVFEPVIEPVQELIEEPVPEEIKARLIQPDTSTKSPDETEEKALAQDEPVIEVEPEVQKIDKTNEAEGAVPLAQGETVPFIAGFGAAGLLRHFTPQDFE